MCRKSAHGSFLTAALYHMTRSRQRELIDQVMDDVLDDDTVRRLEDLTQGYLTDTQKNATVGTQDYLIEQVYPQIMTDGYLTETSAKEYAKGLQNADAVSMQQYLEEMGYETAVTESTRSRSSAQVVRVSGQSAAHNISQVQFSPGGGRHGPNPYIKFSTTDQGIIKIVFGDPSTYRTTGPERAIIIFAEEMK